MKADEYADAGVTGLVSDRSTGALDTIYILQMIVG